MTFERKVKQIFPFGSILIEDCHKLHRELIEDDMLRAFIPISSYFPRQRAIETNIENDL